MTLTVEPADAIDPNGYAKVSHSGSATITVTIKGSEPGQIETIQVPANSTVTWEPPEGWESARFLAPGCSEEYRVIGASAGA